MGNQAAYIEDLPEITSEFIEPYAQRFLMSGLESIAHGLTTPEEVKRDLKAVEYFISMFGGIHAKWATQNIYGKTYRLTDSQLKEMANKVFKTDHL